MDPRELRIDPDIRFAAAPPGEIYGDPVWHAALVERVLAPGWHVVARTAEVAARESAVPITLLPGTLDTPLVLTRDRKDRLHALSNVCTHRGHAVACAAGAAKLLRCPRHGRTFRLDGELMEAPGTEGAIGFPSPSDSLTRAAVAEWGPLVFASIAPSAPFEDVVRPLRERCGDVDLGALAFDPAASRDIEIAASWVLCVELALDALRGARPGGDDVAVEPLPHGAMLFDAAPGGLRRVWLFPATVLEVRPWGLVVSVVAPVGPDRTRIRTLVFVGDEALRAADRTGSLVAWDRSDADLLVSAQSGVRSRLGSPGRYSPSRERALHRFHQLVAERLVSG